MPLGLAGAARAPSFARILRRSRPDVFHAHLHWPLAGKYGLAAAVAAGVPATVATLHSFPRCEIDRSNYLQLRLLSQRVGAYIAISERLAYELASTLHWPRAKISVIHNGVDLKRLQRSRDDELRTTLLRGAPGPLVMTACRLVPDKGVDDLVAAAAHCPEAQFVIAGEGPHRGQLEALASRLRVADRVSFLGHRDDVPVLLTACDIFVLPTLWEGVQQLDPNGRDPGDAGVTSDLHSEFLPLAVLEAMAAKRPVIMTPLPQGDALTHEMNGLHVPRRDPMALAAAISRLAIDPALRQRLVSNAERIVETSFSAQASVARVCSLYRSLLSASPYRADGRQATRSPPLAHS